jgi:hypothetical protein
MKKIFFFAISLSALSANAVDRLGIVWESGSQVEGQELGRAEKNLKRALENQTEWGIVAEPLGSLSRRLRDIEEGFVSLENLDPKSEKIEEVLQLLSSATEKNPLFQSIRVDQAKLAWREGRSLASETFLLQAVELHPGGKLSDSLKFSLRGMEYKGLSEKLETLEGKIDRQCLVDLDVFPRAASISLRGFSFGEQRHFELRHGTGYRGWIQAPGYSPREIFLDCLQAAQWMEKVVLDRGHSVSEKTLSGLQALSRREGLRGLFLLHLLDTKRWGLSLYTPGVGVAEVSLEKPILDLSQLEGGGFPLSVGGMSDLLHRHSISPLKIEVRSAPSLPPTVSRGQTAWYAKKKFWAVTGVAAAAVVAGVFLLRASTSTGEVATGQVE